MRLAGASTAAVTSRRRLEIPLFLNIPAYEVSNVGKKDCSQSSKVSKTVSSCVVCLECFVPIYRSIDVRSRRVPVDEPLSLIRRQHPTPTKSPDVERFNIPIVSHTHPEDFDCPRCRARYKVVRMKSERGAAYRMVQCAVCNQLFAPTEGNDILKYFLISRP